MTDVQKDLLRIIAFYDVFEFSMTAEEVFQNVNKGARILVSKGEGNQGSGYEREQGSKDFSEQGGGESREQGNSKFQNQDVALLEVINELDRMLENGILEKEEVFYCLKGRKDLVRQRKKRYPISLQKILKSNKWICALRALPFVRAIYYAGSVAMQNAKRDSDIDLVIQTYKDRLWTARFFVNTCLALFGKRPKPGKTRNTFCTSMFYDGTIDPRSIMSEEKVFQHWIGEKILAVGDSRLGLWVRVCLELFAAAIPDAFYRWIQIRLLMPKALRAANRNHGEMDVCFDNHIAKFHLNEKRKEYNQEYKQRLRSLI